MGVNTNKNQFGYPLHIKVEHSNTKQTCTICKKWTQYKKGQRLDDYKEIIRLFVKEHRACALKENKHV